MPEVGISSTYLGSSQTDLHIVDKMKKVLSMSLQKKILIAAKKSQALCSKNCWRQDMLDYMYWQLMRLEPGKHSG